MSNKVPAFATVDPFDGMTGSDPGVLQNLVGGEWVSVSDVNKDIVDPMNGEPFLDIPDTRDVAPFIAGLKSCPKTGLHNPLKNTERYVMLGRVCAKAATLLAQQEVAHAQVMVGELLGAVINWNREFFGELNGRPLEDKRVDLRTGDIVKLISRSKNRFDAILLDIDNGPRAMTDSGNLEHEVECISGRVFRNQANRPKLTSQTF